MKRAAGEETTLATYRGRGISGGGQSANISVIAKGPELEVRLNGVSVLKARDTTFASGLIGLRLYGDTTKPCDATFANLTFH